MIHGIIYRKPSTHRFEDKIDLPTLILSSVHEKLSICSTSHAWLAQAHEQNEKPLQLSDSSLQIITWARLDNREELAEKLALSATELHMLSDAALILKAYETYDAACTEHLYGDFCFVIYNTKTHHIFCARDQMGVRPFYYYLDEHVFVFSSAQRLFHQLDCVPVKPSMLWASKFLLANSSMDFENTAYENIFKLPPAHQLCITPSDVSKTQYFKFHTNKVVLHSSQEYLERYQAELLRAVKSRIKTPHPLGTESSGGLDSSTVTAYAAKYFDRPLSELYTFSFARLSEEPQHILSVSQQYGLSNNYVCCDIPHRNYNFSEELGVLGAPCEHANGTGHKVFYALAAKHGVRTLLSGFGGDEFVTTLHGDLYFYELLEKKAYRTLYANLYGNALTRALRFAKLYYNTTPNGGKVSRRMQRAFQSRWPDVVIAAPLIEAYGLQAMYYEKGEFDHGYKNLDQFTLENRWAPFVSTRLENCTLMAASYGIDYRWPLLDPRLIQCFLSTPTSEKIKKGMGRYLHRKAVDGIVPDNITWKASKAMGEPVMSEEVPQVLHKSLHPNLHDLIDVPKLEQQNAHLQRVGSRVENMGTTFQLRANIKNVNALDSWLKYYFPNGCDWAHTP